MLLRNGSSVSIAGSPFYGASFIGAAQMAVGWRTRWQNGMYASPAGVIAGDSINDKSGIPNGYGAEGWLMPIKGGGMSSSREVTGEGSLTATLELAKEMSAALTASGTISAADLSLIVSLAADLTGSGTISAATMEAVASLSAALSGSGNITAAALSLIVALEADLAGAGDSAGNLTGLAVLDADITVTGDALSTANVGDAVWSKLLEAGFDASRILRIIAAAAAGKMSGGPGSPTFRNLSDTQDQITGTADSNGNRSSASYGG